MAKVAKIVEISLMTRVVVEEFATDEEIMIAAVPMLAKKALYEASENISEIYNDDECPFGTFDDEETIDYEIIGYKTAEDFNERNGEELGSAYATFAEASKDAEAFFSDFAVVKVQSSDREEIETFPAQ